MSVMTGLCLREENTIIRQSIHHQRIMNAIRRRQLKPTKQAKYQRQDHRAPKQTSKQFEPPPHTPPALHNSKPPANISFFSTQLGTFGRGKRKVEDMQRVIAEARRTGAH
ncbi:60S ribosomal eL36 domain-containing protein [Aspergillus niger CBS 101883]|uniref:60S ribosomal eL36 domain-containing protein n=1 Tax=Aspergillus lacticoffeatus (strain CBS 101883) TaxID=1450533 RepID=UPI000D7ECEBF|nr:uncharacterized protein BO96DRAFT_409968 [Aspergillus niger CBS 101883]PYH59681.1 hypothetical protein BO96DRAFT_409968 [Aspergillus niger CBS 101883]